VPRDDDVNAKDREDPVGIPTDQVPAEVRARATELVGTTISDRYRIQEMLAMGGMGAVYRGEHVHMRKRVAIKVLYPETQRFAELAARFEREAIAGAHIDHPNVVSATDFGRLPDGAYFLVLEYVRGATLHQLMKHGRMTPARAVRIVRQIAAALDAGHQMGVIHRDVKPRNVMLVEGEAELVKLIDYGLAKVPLDRLSTIGEDDMPPGRRVITGMGVVFGTVAYMAPETALGMDAVDERSDLYALGIMLYQLLAGAHPFDAIDPGELFLQQRTMAPPPLHVRAPDVDVPRELEAIVMRLLEKVPERRFQNARELIATLDAFAAGTPPPSTPSGFDPAGLTLSVAGAVPPSIPAPPHLPTTADEAMPKIPPPARLPTVTPLAQGGPPYVPRLARGPVRALGSMPLWLVAGAAVALVVLIAVVFGFVLRGVATTRTPSARLAAGLAEAARASSEASNAMTRRVDQAAAEEWRARLLAAPSTKDWNGGAAAVMALARLDPEALRDREVAAATVGVAVRLEFDGASAADSVFDTLSTRAGSPGIDVLYEIVSARGGTKAAKRAAELLKRKDVLERGSPELIIAATLRDTPCENKKQLFERAGAEGDARALAIMELLRSDRCNARIGQCCFHKNGLLDDAVRTLRARLRKPPP
jgi:serine/threonine-protein kinase